MHHATHLLRAVFVLSCSIALSRTSLASIEGLVQPSDERVREVAEAFIRQHDQVFAEGHAQAADLNKLYEDPLQELELSEMTPAQIAVVEGAGMLMGSPALPDSSLRKPAAERLKQFADEPTVEGAVASILMVQLVGDQVQTPDVQARRQMLERALSHPRRDEAVRRHGLPIIQAIRFAGDRESIAAARDEILELEGLFDGQPNFDLAMQANDYFELTGMLLDANDPKQAQKRQDIRAKLVAYGRLALEQAKAADDDGKGRPPSNELEFLEGALARLDGAAARGDLIGREAPDLTITWSSDPSLDSLDDLRGRVVVLDFWATWCGPCIGSIPNVRELQERYKDYPVTIVGVTSLQGNHVPKEGQPVSTKGDPQKEYDLMRQYMEEQGITWTIAFSEQDLFNPEYGVRGIPFVAILDPQGTVRHAGLHPADPLTAKAGKIDALLKEAGLPVPPPVTADADIETGQ